MQEFFDAPPEGATGQGGRTFKRPLKVTYKSGEVPAAYVEAAKQQLSQQVSDGKVGFAVWDGEAKTSTPLFPFRFVILETYAGVSGKNFDSGVSYWSNRVKDTRTEPVTVYASNRYSMRGEKKHYEPIASGIYTAIKPELPKEARFSVFVVAYCIGIDAVVEIETTGTSRAGMEQAMRNAGQKKTFMLGLADNDHFFGFSQTDFYGVTKEGQPWSGTEKMYWAPEFSFGILSPNNKPDMHAKVVALQTEERERHAYYKAMNTAPAGAVTAAQAEPPTVAVPAVAPIQTNITASHDLSAEDDLPF